MPNSDLRNVHYASRSTSTSLVHNDRGVDRDNARAEVGRRNLHPIAIERIVRDAMQRTPLALTERARLLLARYFSSAVWSIADASSLSALVGRGERWFVHSLDSDLTIEYGWKGTGFRVESVCVGTAGPAPAIGSARKIDELIALESQIARIADDPTNHVVIPLTLSATFDGPVVPETTHDPRIVCMLTGPGTGLDAASGVRTSHWETRHNPHLSGVAEALFQAIPPLQAIMCAPGSYSLEMREPEAWSLWLAPAISLLIHIASAPRSMMTRDRNEQRLREEFNAMDLHTGKAILRIRDALTQRDPVLRELAVFAIGTADPFAAPKVWRNAIDDSARNVRRSAARAITANAEESLRPLMERALHDVDACTRFHAARGLAKIGAGRSMHALEAAMHDTDARVNVAINAALRGQAPPS